MHRFRPLIALTALATLVLPVAAQEAAMPDDAEIAAILSDRIDRDAANVGIVVAVIENGETRFVSHGTHGVDDPRNVDEHTVFEAGSITKVFTNLMLARLVEEGRIDLDAPIAQYLPQGIDLPQGEDGRVITAFDLATHSAGLSGLPDDLLSRGLGNPYSGYGADGLLAWLADYRLDRPIGEKFDYSNAGIALLGLAIEQVTGKPYAELVESKILAPLDLTETSLALTGGAEVAMAQGHDAARTPVPHWDFDAFAPAGALRSTTTDLAKFIAAASGATHPELEPVFSTMLARTRPVGENETVGLGWFVTPIGAGEIVWHNGITGGFRSFAGFERQSGKGVVVLSNMVTEAGIEDIGFHLLDPALPLRDQPRPRTAVEIDPSALTGLVGDYLLAPAVVLSITTEDGRLFAQLTGQDRFEIFPESPTEFFYRVVDAQITFTLEEGRATSLTLHQNGRSQPALRVE